MQKTQPSSNACMNIRFKLKEITLLSFDIYELNLDERNKNFTLLNFGLTTTFNEIKKKSKATKSLLT